LWDFDFNYIIPNQSGFFYTLNIKFIVTKQICHIRKIA
jgi:hypothetical protein